MRYVSYIVPEDSLTTWLPVRSGPSERTLAAAILELSGKVLPSTADTIGIAERVRGRLMRYFENHDLPVPAMVHGKDETGTPLRDHSHLFILPRGNQLQRIDHVADLYPVFEGFCTRRAKCARERLQHQMD